MKRTKILLEPPQKRALYFITALLWLSGAVWMYLAAEDPRRPLWMKIHGAGAMAFLILLGTLLVRHVPAGWQENRQRPSGAWLLALCGVLILSGWGLYYSGSESLRCWTSLIHSYLGLAFPLILILHVLLGRRKI